MNNNNMTQNINTNNRVKLIMDDLSNIDLNDINNKDNKKEEKDNNNEKPEDISDYINIDEQFNNKNLNLKITNEAIEEVEEAKEVSEIRQSSEFYTNELSSENRKQIFQKKEINKCLINKCLNYDNKEISNNNKKIISKRKSKKIIKFNSLKIKDLTPNDSNRSSSKKIYNKTTNNSINNKNNKDNLSKKGKYLNKAINSKNKKNIISYRQNINKTILYKKITKTNHNKNENKNNKNIINNNKSEISNKSYFNNTTKLAKYKDISKTMPNLKKTFDSNRVYNKIDILDNEGQGGIIPVLTSININYNNNKDKSNNIKNNKNLYNNTKNVKSINLVKNNFRNIFGNTRNDIFKKRLKHLNLEYKTNSLNKTTNSNKTNDKLNIPMKIYNQFFNEDKMKLKTKKIKIKEEKYHKFFKGSFLQLTQNKSKDYLNKNSNNNSINNNYTLDK